MLLKGFLLCKLILFKMNACVFMTSRYFWEQVCAKAFYLATVGDNADLKVSKEVWFTDKSPAVGANQQHAVNRHNQIVKNALNLREITVMKHTHSFIRLWKAWICFIINDLKQNYQVQGLPSNPEENILNPQNQNWSSPAKGSKIFKLYYPFFSLFESHKVLYWI